MSTSIGQLIAESQQQYGLAPNYMLADILEERGGQAVSAEAIRRRKVIFDCSACRAITHEHHAYYHECLSCVGTLYSQAVMRVDAWYTPLRARGGGGGDGSGIQPAGDHCYCGGSYGSQSAAPSTRPLSLSVFTCKGMGTGDGAFVNDG